jgi:hypothetical protein
MKYIILLLTFCALLSAITPVPRKKGSEPAGSNTRIVQSSENISSDKDNKKDDDKDKGKDKQDHFKDADSNGINDQREKDFQKIKDLKKDYKTPTKSTTPEKKTSTPKPSKKKQK